jgi:hypothetical protein
LEIVQLYPSNVWLGARDQISTPLLKVFNPAGDSSPISGRTIDNDCSDLKVILRWI